MENSLAWHSRKRNLLLATVIFGIMVYDTGFGRDFYDAMRGFHDGITGNSPSYQADRPLPKHRP